MNKDAASIELNNAMVVFFMYEDSLKENYSNV